MTDQEKQNFMTNVALPMLASYAQFAIQIEGFLNQYEASMGDQSLPPEDNFGLPSGESPFPIDDTVIFTHNGFAITGENLFQAFKMLDGVELHKFANIVQFVDDFIAANS
jgi:hypothetical protein